MERASSTRPSDIFSTAMLLSINLPPSYGCSAYNIPDASRRHPPLHLQSQGGAPSTPVVRLRSVPPHPPRRKLNLIHPYRSPPLSPPFPVLKVVQRTTGLPHSTQTSPPGYGSRIVHIFSLYPIHRLPRL